MSLAPVSIDVPAVTVTTTDAAGNVLAQPQQSVVWHESFRYFRLSQTTDDLFDGYRNAYLALESVLSSIAPQLTNAAGKLVEGGLDSPVTLSDPTGMCPNPAVCPEGHTNR